MGFSGFNELVKGKHISCSNRIEFS